MGNDFSAARPMMNGFKLYLNPETMPSPTEEPTFAPLDGFTKGRKKRVMIATEAELKSAKIKLEDRDYCSHLLLNFRACRKENWPFVVMCHHEKTEYLHCQYEDFIIRMKEYERERRLRTKKHEGKMGQNLSSNKKCDTK